jgi:hypothetical protein
MICTMPGLEPDDVELGLGRGGVDAYVARAVFVFIIVAAGYDVENACGLEHIHMGGKTKCESTHQRKRNEND